MTETKLERQQAWNLMSRKKFELDDKYSELENAKDQYREVLVNETIEEGTIKERDLKLFLGSLGIDIKHIYRR